MNDLATFFRNRNEDKGATYRFEIRTEKLTYQYFVYCRRPVASSAFADRQLSTKDLRDVSDKLQELIEQKGGGGIVVKTNVEGAWANIEVMQCGFDVQPARQFVALSPGRRASWLPISAKHQLAATSHLLIPVDAEAQERLAKFVDQLPWFSYDLEALVLDAIRRPSLDARLDEIETHVFGQTADQARKDASTTTWKRVTATISKATTAPLTYAIVFGALLALLLAMNVAQMKGIEAKLASMTTSTARVGNGTSAATSSGTSAPPEADPPAVVTETRTLLAELKSTSNPTLHTLYETHFHSFDAVSLTDETIKGWFEPERPADNKARWPLLLGLVKLQALTLQPPDTAFIRDPNDVAGARKAFRDVGDAAFQQDRTGQRMVGALACRLGYLDPPRPALPASDKTPEFVATADDCKNLTEVDIANGLRQLVEFVRNDGH